MIWLKEIFLLVFCLLGCIQGEILEADENAQLISSILQYLNERNPAYIHKTGNVVQKIVKEHKLEVTFDVEAICEYPCIGGILKCDSIFQKIPGYPTWYIDGAICAPKEPDYGEQQHYPTIDGEHLSEQDKLAKEHQHYLQVPTFDHDSNNEPLFFNFQEGQPLGTNEKNTEKIVPCLGCPTEVDPHANGVTNLINAALRHIESERNEKHTALRVLRVQQQVVAGIKYDLVIEVAPTVCPKDVSVLSCPVDESKASFICEIEFWEKAWERFSQVIKNNCTNSQEFAYNEPVNTTPKTPEREVDFGDLESQIYSDFDIQQAEHANNQHSSGPAVVLVKRSIENEHVIAKRYSRHSNSDSSSSDSSEEENRHRNKHDRSDCDSDEHDHHHSKHSHRDDSDEHGHKHSHHDDNSGQHSHKHGRRDSSESDSGDRDKHHSGDSSKSIKSSESSDSSESYDHKKKHRHVDVKKKRSLPEMDDGQIVDQLSWIASKILGYPNYQVVGSSKVVLDGIHYKLQLLLEKDRLVIECSVFMTVKERNIYESTIDKYRCNTEEVWKNDRQARNNNFVGGATPLSLDDPHIKFYLKDGLTQLDATSSHTNKYKILKVIEATKQVVSGVLYRIKAHVAVSDCEKSKNIDTETCGVLKDAPVKVCYFKIWDQPWRQEGRQTNVTCDDEEVRHPKVKRSEENLLGGINHISKDDPHLKSLLRYELNNLDQTSTHDHKYKVLEVLEASRQVVNGFFHRIKVRITVSDCKKTEDVDPETCGVLKDAPVRTCDFEVIESPGDPKAKETNATCTYEEKNNIRPKRSKGGLAGGISNINKDDPEVKRFLKDGLSNMDQSSPHAHKYKVLDVLEASVQVVSGSLHRIKARITVSDCEKSKNVDPEKCGVLKDAPVKVCNFKVWDQPWLPQGRQTNITCENDETYHFRQRRSLTGGINSISKDDPQVKTHLKNSLNHLDSSSSDTNKYKVVEVLEASKQVVSGSLYRIKARIALSDCVKGSQADSDTCGILQDAPVKECDFKIWSQPWRSPGTETNITCDDEVHTFRQRRSIELPPHEDVVRVFFKQFQMRFSKIYQDKAEHNHRLTIFKNNLNMIDLLNKYEQGTARYGITEYTDLTPAEFSKLHGLRTDLRSENDIPFMQAEIPDIELPTSVDWRDKNAVTGVKDQGSCGSCWAFSTTGNIEGQYAIKYKTLKSFSEQELVDCDKLDDGCNGGLMDNAYRAIENLGGLELESVYPYDAVDERCHFNKSKVVVHVASALNISHNETDMAKWLAQNGPISIAINANAMQFYMGGVSHPFKIFCSPKSLDHGVLIVGYGVDDSRKKPLPYWVVKNSWGSSWGEKGYYRVYRGDGTCGLNQTPSSAVVS